MPRTIISEGKTSTEAIEKGLKELRLTRNQVEIKILEEKKKSFFNILDPHIVKVEINEKEGVKESQERRPRKEEKRPINKQKAKKADAEASAFKALPFLFQFQYSVFSFRSMSAARNTGFLPALRCSV